mmetsp:Transcript_15234/g.30354  ORF Transcript_15234/g.30354 Transcript_15234/m.30354 type:complete len:229 (-) Transcript_15234:409-1095(-)
MERSAPFFIPSLLALLCSLPAAAAAAAAAVPASCPAPAALPSYLPHSTAGAVALLVLCVPGTFWLVAYLVPQLWMAFGSVPDLKKKYPGATYALVTGAGSGIGKALCFKLASQGLNVVAVSIDDDFLTATGAELRKAYPELDIRTVGCTFSPGTPYMEKIIEATKDVTVQIVFNNAGFIVLGFFEQAPLGKLLANVECNATSTVSITHHFTQIMVARRLKGCVVFTGG